MIKDAPEPISTAEKKDAGSLIRSLFFCTAVSLIFYWAVTYIAGALTSSRPTFASEVFPWVRNLTQEGIQALRLHEHAANPNISFAACCVILFGLYGYALRLVKGCESLAVQRMVFAAGAVFVLWPLMAPVMLSTDVFAYGYYGRVVSMYGASAYVPNPQLSGDTFYQLFNGQCPVSMYGPLWTLMSAVITRTGGEHVGFTVLMFRAVSALSVLGTAWFIWKSLRAYSPKHATAGLVMFLWNPLVILESGLSGHNDATMVALAMLGVWLHYQGWKVWATVAFLLSAMVKFITGMLVPLYMLMVLRNMKTWRERIFFTLRCGVCAVVIFAAVLPLVNVKVSLARKKSSDEPNVPAGAQATSPAFYANNFQELIFRGLRRTLGEDPETVKVPIYEFGSWWLTATEKTVLRAGESADAPAKATIELNQNLLAIAPHMTDWLRVYDPVSHQRGYVFGDALDVIDRPAIPVGSDPELDMLEKSNMEWPTVVKANKIVRLVTWGLFALFGLLAAWKTVDFDRFLLWGCAALLASYYLVMTQMWPWYILWALAFGAMKPNRLPARLSILISGFVLTLYISLTYASGTKVWEEWMYGWRGVWAILVPMVLFLVTLPFWRGRKAADAGVNAKA